MVKKNRSLIIGLMLALTAVLLVGCGQGSTVAGGVFSSQQEGIWVTGRGEVSVVPDIVNLRLGIEAREESVAEAQTQAKEAMDRVMSALRENGVAEKDIKTQYFSIRRITKWDRDTEEEVVTGYLVTNMVTAKLRDTDKAGSIIDAVARAGGDLTRIDNIAFSVDDPSPYYEEARKKAIVEAQDKAEQLAKLAGVRLGKPTYISEGAQTPPIYQRIVEYEYAAAQAPAETPISPGEMEISLTVNVAYAILK